MKIKKLIDNFNDSGKSLSQHVVRGGFWVFLLRITQQLFNFVRLVILARVLSPNDFGLMGIALLTMATLDTFSQTGFQQALIQKKEDIKPYLDSAWTVLILRGFILFTILFFIAPYVATFFNAPEAKPIVQVIGFALLFQAFTNIGVVYFQRELEFNKQFIYQLSGTLVDFVVAISTALILKSVWALVFGLVTGNFAKFVVSYLIHPYRPHLSLDLEKMKELFGFGKWILGSSILVFLITQGDDIFVGKLLGATALGFYQMAYRISNIPATEITHVISQVTFPAYSKLQDNIPKLREAYLKVLQITAFLSFPIAGLIFVLAPDFTKIFLGEKWMPMVPAMQVLTLAGLIRSIAATSGPIFKAVGKMRIDTELQIIRFGVLVALIYPFTAYWKILGTSVAVFLSILVNAVGYSFIVVKFTQCGIKNFVKMIVPPLISGTIMMLVMFLLKINRNVEEIWKFVLFVMLGIFTYFFALYLQDKLFNYKLGTLLKKSLILFRRNQYVSKPD